MAYGKRRLRLDVRKFFFLMRTVKQWNVAKKGNVVPELKGLQDQTGLSRRLN